MNPTCFNPQNIRGLWAFLNIPHIPTIQLPPIHGSKKIDSPSTKLR